MRIELGIGDQTKRRKAPANEIFFHKTYLESDYNVPMLFEAEIGVLTSRHTSGMIYASWETPRRVTVFPKNRGRSYST